MRLAMALRILIISRFRPSVKFPYSRAANGRRPSNWRGWQMSWDVDVGLARMTADALRRSRRTRLLARALGLVARTLAAQPRVKVERVLKEHPEGLTARDIARYTHLKVAEVRSVLGGLLKEGKVEAHPRKGRRGPGTTVYVPKTCRKVGTEHNIQPLEGIASSTWGEPLCGLRAI